MKRYISIIMLFAVYFFGNAQIKTGKTTIQYRNDGTRNDKLSLDIYNPSPTANKPVVIFVHGGAWLLGDKATKINKKVALFKKLDVVLVSVNYRLSSFFNTDVAYPDHPNDVADAVKWIYENIQNYGGNHEKMVLMGHSAGAQIVSLLGTSNEFLPKRGIDLNKIKGVASMDTEGYDVAGMGNAGVKIYKRIFGTDAKIWQDASPIAQISNGKTYPDFLVVTRGESYRKEMSQKFAEKLRAAGAYAEVYDAEPYSHFEVNNKIGDTNDRIITPKLVNFLQKQFSRP